MPRNVEKHRAAKKLRYEDYKQLCAAAGVATWRQSWWRHYAELQKANDDERRLTRDEHYAFWTERFTFAQLHEMASALDFLSTEGRVIA